MGAETEYGIHTPGNSSFNATWLSTQVVHAYSKETGHRAAAGGETRWDYTDEDPLADARGWVLPRQEADPSQLTDSEPELTAAQIALEELGVLAREEPLPSAVASEPQAPESADPLAADPANGDAVADITTSADSPDDHAQAQDATS